MKPVDYQRYLASREWGLLKVAVRERSGGVCENCRRRPAVDVHHETYERKGHEDLGDLLHVCRPCHEYKSGLSHYNPAEPPPVRSLMEARREAHQHLREQAAAGDAEAADRLEVLRRRGLLVGG